MKVMKRQKFSVLMSVYGKEKSDYLDLALKSIFESTVYPDQVILVEDGPIPTELRQVINKYKENNEIISPSTPQNMGLTNALNLGLQYCTYDLIARMDTDDYCHPCRFEKQLALFEDESIIVVGSDVAEFVETHEKIISVKKMPIEGETIKKYSFSRNPFNHPSVMFRKKAVIGVSGYENFRFFEDYHLWLKLLNSYPPSSFRNIDECLVSMRTVDDLYDRRGGWSYCKDISAFRYDIIKKKLVPTSKTIVSGAAACIVALLPNNVRKRIYLNLLRSPKVISEKK
ncbi:glycosyltransferase [Erysipelothrix rhusiopathiae]|uniref:Glycosyltransferase n=1 Tax=Erysipelothrix rhusiopathiae TaxID=1648 RepID=A0A6S6I510_ERYRH|nr:glycosyltransferase [Erysipelothrix rhusiopathiae]